MTIQDLVTIGQAKQISLQMVVEHFWVPPTFYPQDLSRQHQSQQGVANAATALADLTVTAVWVWMFIGISQTDLRASASPEHGWNLEEQYDVHI